MVHRTRGVSCRLGACAVAALIGTATLEAGADTVIVNSPGQGAFQNNTTYKAQTVIVPTLDTVLEAFTLEALAAEAGITFRAFVARWDVAGQRVSGPLLFESDQVLVSTNTFAPYGFTTGPLAFAAGETIVLFAREEQRGEVIWGLLNQYPVGQVFELDFFDLADVGSTAWTRREFNTAPPLNLAFTATFSTAPPPPLSESVQEPPALLLFCVAAAFVTWRRARA